MPGVDIIHRKDGTVARITFTQSWLGSLMSCPEQARRDLVGTLPRKSTDATVTGSVFHLYAELRARGACLEDAYTSAVAQLDHEVQQPEFEFVQVQSTLTMAKHLNTCIGLFEDEVFPGIDPLHVEKKFSAHLLFHEGIDLRIQGTPDYIDHDLEIGDYKTASAEYQPWEYKRWAIQPTAYAYLLDQSLPLKKRQDSYLFRYVVLLKTLGRLQTFTVERDQSHFGWLKEQCVSAADMILSGTDKKWLLNDQSWKCSPKWCAAHSTCRGQYVTVEPQPASTP